MDNKDSVWGRYWIVSGLEVVHRDHITELNADRLHLFKMTVDRVIKRSKDKDGVRKTFIDGVRCHWIDNDRKYQTGDFHTGELVPYEVAKIGLSSVNKWLVRTYDV